MFITKRKLRKALSEFKNETRREKLYAKYPAKTEEQKIKNAYSMGYEDGIDNMCNGLIYRFKL